MVEYPLLVGFTLWVLPRVGDWFFVRLGRERVQRLLFALVGMAASAGLAVAGGIAGIIGAFLAGIGLNRLVPKNSELMDRIDFVGSSVFVPAFLVSIGLRIDPAAMVDRATILMGVIFLGLVVVGKGLSVLVAARFFGYSSAEKGLIGSLSIGQAASTLAVGQIGLELGLFEQRVVNASILTIVLAALLTSIGTQYFIRKMPAPDAAVGTIGDKVLVDSRQVSSNMRSLVEFAGRVARGDDGVQTPFVLAPRRDKEQAKRLIAEAEGVALAAGYDTEGQIRLSDSFVNGALELLDESEATMVVLDWTGPRPGFELILGDQLDGIGAGSPVVAVAAHLVGPWERVIVTPGNRRVGWHTEDARLSLEIASLVRGRGDSPLVVIANSERMVSESLGEKAEYEFIQADVPGTALLTILRDTDLVIAPAYLLPEMPLPRRLRLASRLADQNLAIVAGPGRLAVAPQSIPHGMERMLGQHA